MDVMLTMCSANCNYFYELFFKKDQLRSTIFNSIANYIFSLWKAIYSVVFALICLSPFMKNIQEVKLGARLSVFIKRTFRVGPSALLNSIRKGRNVCSCKDRRNLMSYSHFVGNELHMKNKNQCNLGYSAHFTGVNNDLSAELSQ